MAGPEQTPVHKGSDGMLYNLMHPMTDEQMLRFRAKMDDQLAKEEAAERGETPPSVPYPSEFC